MHGLVVHRRLGDVRHEVVRAVQLADGRLELLGYAVRPTTLREHRAEIEASLGPRAFDRADVRSMRTAGAQIAASTDRGDASGWRRHRP